MDKQTALEELRKLREIGLQMGGEERIGRQHQRGHLTARERLEKLLDPGTFMEQGLLELFEIPGSGGRKIPTSRIHGFGKIGGKPFMFMPMIAPSWPGLMKQPSVGQEVQSNLPPGAIRLSASVTVEGVACKRSWAQPALCRWPPALADHP